MGRARGGGSAVSRGECTAQCLKPQHMCGRFDNIQTVNTTVLQRVIETIETWDV